MLGAGTLGAVYGFDGNNLQQFRGCFCGHNP